MNGLIKKVKEFIQEQGLKEIWIDEGNQFKEFIIWLNYYKEKLSGIIEIGWLEEYMHYSKVMIYFEVKF